LNGGVRVSDELGKRYKIDPATLVSLWREREEHARKFANKYNRRERY